MTVEDRDLMVSCDVDNQVIFRGGADWLHVSQQGSPG
jgi:hypothetical protein